MIFLVLVIHKMKPTYSYKGVSVVIVTKYSESTNIIIYNIGLEKSPMIMPNNNCKSCNQHVWIRKKFHVFKFIFSHLLCHLE
jgi:hypothetical protein